MNAAATTVVIAAAAAAERHRQMCQEEEEMTAYSPDELAQDWEFKVLRSAVGAFKRPEVLRQLLDEEARAGWVLVEKFDDARVRLKRPASARERDLKLDFDPYRTNVGPSPNYVALMVLGAVLGLLLALALLAVSLEGCTSPRHYDKPLPTLPPVQQAQP